MGLYSQRRYGVLMAVKFDAANNGATANASSGTLSVSWTHTNVGTASLCVIVGAVVGQAGTGTPTATYGGVTMSVIGSISGPSSTGSVRLFGLLNPPTGGQ